MPARGVGELRLALLQVRLRRPDDVAATRLPQPRQILCARHTPIGDPYASEHTMATLHGLNDLLQGR